MIAFAYKCDIEFQMIFIIVLFIFSAGEVIPAELLDRMMEANKFGQGFATIEYSACVLVDIALHQLTDVSGLDIAQFERAELGRLGMPRGMVMRHRPAHFARKCHTHV